MHVLKTNPTAAKKPDAFGTGASRPGAQTHTALASEATVPDRVAADPRAVAK